MNKEVDYPPHRAPPTEPIERNLSLFSLIPTHIFFFMTTAFFKYQRLCCCCCCRQVASVVSDSVRPHRREPTRLPRPWDSPGKNTGVGCHFLLQCMQVKSESEVVQSCPTLRDPMDCSLPDHNRTLLRGSEQISIHWDSRSTTLCWPLLHTSMNQPPVYTCPLLPELPSHPYPIPPFQEETSTGLLTSR